MDHATRSAFLCSPDAPVAATDVEEYDSADDSGQAFLNWARNLTAARANEEGWTNDDRLAAFIQTSLLSFKSHPDSTEIFGDCYCPTSPEDHRFNAPWNDWTPPSKSGERFRDAQARRKPEPIENRVRVRLCNSAGIQGLTASMIVFARVEISNGKRYLQLLRGSDVLASMSLTSLHMAWTSERMMALTPRTTSGSALGPVVFLSFEDQKRVAKFGSMLL